MPASASQPTASSSPSAAFSPLGASSSESGSKHLPYPEVSVREGLPIRPERHVQHSIASLRRRIAVALVTRLPRCPCCLTKPAQTRNKKGHSQNIGLPDCEPHPDAGRGRDHARTA